MSDLESGVRRRAKPRICDPRDKAPPTRRRYLLSDALPKRSATDGPSFAGQTPTSGPFTIERLKSRSRALSIGYYRAGSVLLRDSFRFLAPRLSSYLIILSLIAIDVSPSRWSWIV